MNKYLEYKGFIYIFIFFTAFYFMLSSGHFYATDEAHIYQTTQSLITKGELSIPELLLPTKGAGGKYYSSRGIASSIVAVPYYLAGVFIEKTFPPRFVEMLARKKYGDYRDFVTGDIKIFAVSQLNIHLTALLCCMFYLLSLRLGFTINTSILSAFILGTATIICAYSKTFHSQTLATLSLLSAVYFIFSERKQSDLLLSGAFVGITLLTRLETVLVIPAFIFYILKKETLNKLFIFLLPVTAAVTLYGVINYIKFNAFFTTGFRYAPGEGFNGSLLDGLYGNLFSVGRSIFIFSPPIIISMFYIKRFLTDYKAEAVFLYAMAVIVLISCSKFSLWHATWSWGNRYQFISIPFLLLPLGYFIEGMFVKKNIWKIIFIGFFVLTGFFVQVLGMTPDMWNLAFNYDWAKINPDLKHFYDYYVFIPRSSPVPVHWEVVSAGKYIDYWFYHIFKNYGILWTLFFASIPLLGITVSVRGILKIMKASVQNSLKKVLS